MRGWTEDLDKYAAEFLTAKAYRYPASERPSSEEKRVLHFARAMAGIMTGISPARAIDLIRAMKHGERCECTKCHVSRWDRFEQLVRKDRTED